MTAQSTPHLSNSKFILAIELTPSTNNKAGCFVSFNVFLTPSISLVTPVAVSL